MSPRIERVLQRLSHCFDNHEPEKTAATSWLFDCLLLADAFHIDNRRSCQWDVHGVGKITVAFEISSRIHIFIHKGTKHETWSSELAQEDFEYMRAWLTANKLAGMGGKNE